MKTAELTALGISEEVASQILAINGKDINSVKASRDKEVADLTAERDSFKSQYETAAATLKKFDGIDPEKIQGELADYKKKAEDAEKNFTTQIMKRDQRDWIRAKLDAYGVKSPLARKQIAAEVMSDTDGLKWQPEKEGKPAAFMGFDDYMKAAKADDPNLYQTEEEKKAAEEAARLKDKAPQFTGPAGGNDNNGGKKYTPPRVF